MYAAKNSLANSSGTAGYFYNGLKEHHDVSVLHKYGDIPKDIALVGYDDLYLAEYAPIPLTTISQPLHKMAVRSIDILDQVVDGYEIKHPKNRYTPILKHRKSS